MRGAYHSFRPGFCVIDEGWRGQGEGGSDGPGFLRFASSVSSVFIRNPDEGPGVGEAVDGVLRFSGFMAFRTIQLRWKRCNTMH